MHEPMYHPIVKSGFTFPLISILDLITTQHWPQEDHISTIPGNNVTSALMLFLKGTWGSVHSQPRHLSTVG